MSSFIQALDNLTPTQLGENAHSEYTWSNKLNEQILQLSFQLTRTNNKQTISKLASMTDTILTTIKNNYIQSIISKDTYLTYMSIMYRMIAHTRDIVDGKGEYKLSYMLLSTWYKHFPDSTKFIFKHFVFSDENNIPFGSWKDIKKMFQYQEEYPEYSNYGVPLACYGMELMNAQIKEDYENLQNNSNKSISLVAKWVPREKSKFSKVFTNLATNYFAHYIDSAYKIESKKKAILKAKTEYRKIISQLNKHLDTVQIKQCENTWSLINPSKQTSITMHKQKKAFLNLKKDGKERSDSEDRRICAENFRKYATDVATNKVKIKGKRIGLNDFVKNALTNLDSSEIQILNAQWENNSSQTGQLGNMIAMVDVSGSMNGDPLYTAIGLGIRVAEKSILGPRILTFSAYPSWINLSPYHTFVQKVNHIKDIEWGMNTNFCSALNMILDAIMTSSLKPEDVENLILAVFSDMQIDQADTKFKSMYEMIENKYADAGMRLWGKPFKPPHILFWNLRSTSGFPSLSTQKNVSMLSGFSPALLNIFCEQGIEELQQHCNPWNMFLKTIEGQRYKFLDTYLRNNLI
jgi:hypothetical protein